MMPRNKLRQLLRDGKPTVGTHFYSTWTNLVEIIGNTQLFDYAEFVSQYGPYTPHDLHHIARACEVTGMDSMIKLDQAPPPFLVSKAIQAGFTAILFTDCATPEDVRKCVRSVKLIPQGGTNGLQLGRNWGYGIAVRGRPVTTAEYVKFIDDIVILFMIETKTLADDIEEALSVPGIDMIQFGPGDYSVAIGQPGERYKSAQITEAMERCNLAAKRKGIRFRCEDEDQVQAWINMGCKDFCLGSDARAIWDYTQRIGTNIRKDLAEAKLL